ncbi:hypothetical protein BP6252_04048 [Coleophoma cylindrospora]|uniref:Zn(2)-C6 fungal-type domain-containing protein n=1 Tax=Coleophoma cylindrospora TaxID=1849047 RepID=A0A3D8RZX0_9HELO|nr:hypothetical protein BP6252_04048 [Coleophoma cylindrospora]
MPASLRRACYGCISAKRRCDPQLPKCPRCLKNGLVCTYDNQPLSHVQPPADDEEIEPPPDVPAQPTFLVFSDIVSAERVARKFFDMQSVDPHLSIPELRVVPDPGIVYAAISQIANIPKAIAQGQTSPLVHSQLHHRRPEDSIRLEHVLLLQKSFLGNPPSEIKSPSRNTHLQRLMKTSVLDLPLVDILIRVHELVLYIIVYSCNSFPSPYMSEIRPCLDILLRWIEYLWTVTQQPPTNSDGLWQNWVVAESTRRSIIACAIVRGAVAVASCGYCAYQPFLEALPFDNRNGLWEAMTEDAWTAAVAKHGGEPEVLVSFHEFIQGYEDISGIMHEGLFQRLLLIMYHGSEALDALGSS